MEPTVVCSAVSKIYPNVTLKAFSGFQAESSSGSALKDAA